MTDKLLIVGYTGGTHVGASLARAADKSGIPHLFVDATRAFAGPRLIRSAYWRLAGHRPPRLRSLSRAIVALCARHYPRWLLSTGLAPVDAQSLSAIGRLGVQRLNFLTDDPWNPSFRADWFFDALQHYDRVFTPRRANVSDLRRQTRAEVSYLPFGYDPDLSFPEEPAPSERAKFAVDVAFVGGADADRVPYIGALARAGVRLAVYGGYWNRFPETRSAHRGHADIAAVRKATSTAKVALCLVRRANRDGHVMRSLEIPAMGGCLLAEDTPEHRALLGPPDESAVYFRTIPEMLDRMRWLVSADDERHRLVAAAQRRLHDGRHTYADRLRAMLDAAG